MTTNRDRKTIENLPGPALVALWNELHPEKPVRRFATRQAGVDRVLRALEEREAAKPAQRGAAASAPTKAPRAVRRTEHVPTGPTKPPRPGSKRAALLAKLVGGGSSAADIGSEFAWKPNDVRDALRLLASENGYCVYLGDDGLWHAAERDADEPTKPRRKAK